MVFGLSLSKKGKSAAGSATQPPKKVSKKEEKSNSKLLGSYSDFMIESWPSVAADKEELGDNEIDLSSPRAANAVTVPDSPCEKTFMLSHKMDDLGLVDDMVENTRGTNTVYDLRGKIPNAPERHGSRTYGSSPRYAESAPRKTSGTNKSSRFSKSSESFVLIEDYESSDILFDAEDMSEVEDTPAPVIELSSVGIAEQFSRLNKQYDSDGEDEQFELVSLSKASTTSNSFLGQRSPNQQRLGFGELNANHVPFATPLRAETGVHRDFEFRSFLVDDSDIRETILEYTPACREIIPAREPDPDFFDARDVQQWDAETRDLVINFEMDYMSMGQILPPKSVPTPLVVDTGVENPFLGPSALMLKRLEKWGEAPYLDDDRLFLGPPKFPGGPKSRTSSQLLSVEQKQEVFTTRQTYSEDTDRLMDPEEEQRATYSDGADKSSEARDLEDEDNLESICLHDANVRPGIDFLPGIDHLTNITVRPVCILYNRNHYLETESTGLDGEDGGSIDVTDNLRPITFFDTNTQQEVGYYAMNQQIESREPESLRRSDDDDLPAPPREDADEFNLDSLPRHGEEVPNNYLDVPREQYVRIFNDGARVDFIYGSLSNADEPQSPIGLDYNDSQVRPILKINTALATIPEEASNSSSSSSSDASIDFESCRGFVRLLEQRRAGFLDDEFLTPDLNPTSLTDVVLNVSCISHCEDRSDEGAEFESKVEEMPQIGVEPLPDEEFEDASNTLAVAVVDSNMLHAHRNSRESMQKSRLRLMSDPQLLAHGNIQDLEKDIGNLIERIVSRIPEDSLQNLQQISEDTDWALKFLSQTYPSSRLIPQLQIAIQALEERMKSSSPSFSESSGGIDQVWSGVWTPNDIVDPNQDYKKDDKNAPNLEQLAQLSFPTSDDPSIPFSLDEARSKFMLWASEDGKGEPGDPYYEMLTYAQLVSTQLLEAQADVSRAIERFTKDYVRHANDGNVVTHMEAMSKEIREKYDPELPSCLEGKTVGDIIDSVQDMYQSLRLTPELIREKTPLKILRLLEEWEREIKEWITHLQSISIQSLQADHTYHMANRFWNTSFTCMGEIENAHQKVAQDSQSHSLMPQMMLMENLIWCDWIDQMHDSVAIVERFDGKIHPSFLPSVSDFLIYSLLWWEAKICRKIRRIQSAHA